MSVRLLHLSDPHFGTERPPAVAALLRAAEALAPDLVVISGDITQRATAGEFAAAADFVRRLAPLPLRVVPGNHDIPLWNLAQRLFKPRARFDRAFFIPEPPPWCVGGVELLCFDSTSRWRHKNGALKPAELSARLAEVNSPGLRVVAFHHPLDCRKDVDEENLVQPGPAIARALAEGGVDLVLGGHIHDPYVALAAERFPGVSRAPVVALAGTCLSHRLRAGAPNSFNLVALDAARARMVIERWDLISDRDFACVGSRSYGRSADGEWQRLDSGQQVPQPASDPITGGNAAALTDRAAGIALLPEQGGTASESSDSTLGRDR